MRLPDSRLSARHHGLSQMLIYSLTALALAVLFLWAGTRKARNRRKGLGAPHPDCIGTREQRYMRSEPGTRSIS